MHKPNNDFLSSLGPSVEMSTETIEAHDPRMDEMLREIGARVGLQTGLDYQGSFAIHLYRSPDGQGSITGKYSMSSITQIAINEKCSEQMCTLGFNNAVLQLRRYFKPSTKTGRRGDNR